MSSIQLADKEFGDIRYDVLISALINDVNKSNFELIDLLSSDIGELSGLFIQLSSSVNNNVNALSLFLLNHIAGNNINFNSVFLSVRQLSNDYTNLRALINRNTSNINIISSEILSIEYGPRQVWLSKTSISASVADDAHTVNGHYVGCDVPDDAVFTDTTYDLVDYENAGLMSSADKIKLDSLSAIEPNDANIIYVKSREEYNRISASEEFDPTATYLVDDINDDKEESEASIVLSVTVDLILTGGSHIADITVDGKKTEIYAPTGGSSSGNTGSDSGGGISWGGVIDGTLLYETQKTVALTNNLTSGNATDVYEVNNDCLLGIATDTVLGANSRRMFIYANGTRVGGIGDYTDENTADDILLIPIKKGCKISVRANFAHTSFKLKFYEYKLNAISASNCVKTINNISPDSNGNVNLPGDYVGTCIVKDSALIEYTARSNQTLYTFTSAGNYTLCLFGAAFKLSGPWNGWVELHHFSSANVSKGILGLLPIHLEEREYGYATFDVNAEAGDKIIIGDNYDYEYPDLVTSRTQAKIARVIYKK